MDWKIWKPTAMSTATVPPWARVIVKTSPTRVQRMISPTMTADGFTGPELAGHTVQ
jgi:hypothetical protein